MKIVRVTEPAEFDATIEKLQGEDQLYVCLFGSEDPKTGESWCPDCVVADPLIRSALSKVEGSILVECPVGDRSVYKNNPSHPYRVHPKIKLTAVPTLIKWTKDGPGERLVEEELAHADEIDKMLKA